MKSRDETVDFLDRVEIKDLVAIIGTADQIHKEPLKDCIPTLKVVADNLCEAWERSVLMLWLAGCQIATQYDKPDDPLSRDATMVIEVTDPLSEPRLYKGFPGGLVDLWKYRQEVVEGVHDHWVDTKDPAKWDYTYHQRLFNYQLPTESIIIAVYDLLEATARQPYLLKDLISKEVSVALAKVFGINHEMVMDQINDYVIPGLAAVPHSRRIQAITWQVATDTSVADPSCLQRLWFRILNDKLHMNSHWRSRDAFKAAYMNMFAMIELQKMVAEKVSQLRGEKIEVGPYKDISDSYHIYGADFSNEKLPISFQGWLDWLSKHLGGINDRAWTTEFAIENFDFINEAEKQLAEE